MIRIDSLSNNMAEIEQYGANHEGYIMSKENFERFRRT